MVLGMVEELSTASAQKASTWKPLPQKLRPLRGRFFITLKKSVTRSVSPCLNHPEMELLEIGRSNLLEQLIALRAEQGGAEPDLRRFSTPAQISTSAASPFADAPHFLGWASKTGRVLTGPGEVARFKRLLRRPVTTPQQHCSPSRKESQALNRLQLLRRPPTPYAKPDPVVPPKRPCPTRTA